MTTRPADVIADVLLFGNRFLTEEVASREFPETGMPALEAMRLVAEDLALEGDPARNLATFVTTWMEPEAQRTYIATSSITPNIRAPPKSSSAASGCSPTCSTHQGRQPAHERKAPPRQSCSARCR